MANDPFSDILALTEAKTVIAGGIMSGGRWAIRFPVPGKLKFSAIAKGSCWMRIDGQRKAVRFDQGDVMMMPGNRGFVIGSDLTVPAKPPQRMLSVRENGFAKIGDGRDSTMLSGMVSLHPATGSLLLDVLPPLIHVRAGSPQAAPLRWIVEQIMAEQGSGLPGSSIAAAQLAQLMFVQILRAHLGGSGTLPACWLRAINDVKLAPALRLMHDKPGKAWRLGELAKAAAMSRTSFAVHFKDVCGSAPLEYLTEWRMRLAQRTLREGETSVAELAGTLGYASESAFSNAFKRVTGTAPRNYRSAMRREARTIAHEVRTLAH